MFEFHLRELQSLQGNLQCAATSRKRFPRLCSPSHSENSAREIKRQWFRVCLLVQITFEWLYVCFIKFRPSLVDFLHESKILGGVSFWRIHIAILVKNKNRCSHPFYEGVRYTRKHFRGRYYNRWICFLGECSSNRDEQSSLISGNHK